MSGTTTPPAGWYDDPSQPGMQRYWDGSAWTASTRPLPDTQVPASAEVVETTSTDVEAVPRNEVEEAPPPWAAEVVEAEAAAYNATPWWKEPKFAALLLLAGGLAAIALFFGLTGGERSEIVAENVNDTSRTVTEPDEPDVVAVDDQPTGDAEVTEVDSTVADDDTNPPTTTSVPAAEAASPAGDTPTSVAPAEVDEGTEADTAPVDETDDATDVVATTTPAETTTTTTTTTTIAEVVSPEGVSDTCLAAMQDAADVPDEVDVPQDLFPTFSACGTLAEWQEAAQSTGIDGRVDITSWVPVGCVLNAEFYELPLCTSTIDPNSGPRRIDCADGVRRSNGPSSTTQEATSKCAPTISSSRATTARFTTSRVKRSPKKRPKRPSVSRRSVRLVTAARR